MKRKTEKKRAEKLHQIKRLHLFLARSHSRVFLGGRLSILCNTDFLQDLKVDWHITNQNSKQIKSIVELWMLSEYCICYFLLWQTWNKVKHTCKPIILLFFAILIWVLWKYFKCKNVWNTLWTHIHSLSRFILSKNILPQGRSFFFIF